MRGQTPKDEGPNPGDPLRYTTSRSAPPISIFAHSRDLGKGPSHQSHILVHRDTCGQAQIWCKGHHGEKRTVDRPCQPSLCDKILACTKSATSEYSSTSQCLSALLGRLGSLNSVDCANAELYSKTIAYVNMSIHHRNTLLC